MLELNASLLPHMVCVEFCLLGFFSKFQIFACLDFDVSEPFLSLLLSPYFLCLKLDYKDFVSNFSFCNLHSVHSLLLPLSKSEALLLSPLLVNPMDASLLSF